MRHSIPSFYRTLVWCPALLFELHGVAGKLQSEFSLRSYIYIYTYLSLSLSEMLERLMGSCIAAGTRGNCYELRTVSRLGCSHIARRQANSLLSLFANMYSDGV